jgi:hypothetical protein
MGLLRPHRGYDDLCGDVFIELLDVVQGRGSVQQRRVSFSSQLVFVDMSVCASTEAPSLLIGRRQCREEGGVS